MQHGVNLIPQSCKNKWYPEASNEEPEGMYIMQKLPPVDRIINPMAFVSDGRATFNATMNKIESHFGATQPDVVESWRNFEQRIPVNEMILLKIILIDFQSKFEFHLKIYCLLVNFQSMVTLVINAKEQRSNRSSDQPTQLHGLGVIKLLLKLL